MIFVERNSLTFKVGYTFLQDTLWWSDLKHAFTSWVMHIRSQKASSCSKSTIKALDFCSECVQS